MSKRVVKIHKRQPVKKEPCAHCEGKGLCAEWKRLGYRVPVGSRLGGVSKESIPCEYCGQ